MSILYAMLQGLLQGLTEFLPVSSSGHLAVFQHFFGQAGNSTLFFNLMLHLGTLAAVITAYYEDIWELIKEFIASVKEIFTGRFSFKTDNPNRKMLYMLIVATLPLVIVVPLRGVVAAVTQDQSILVEGIGFLFTSALLFGACKAKRGKAGALRMGPKQAVAIGVMQGVATFPGVSRSGSTISTGLILGFDRAFMVKFSFLLGIPAILGGAVFEIGDAAQEADKPGFMVLFAGMLTAAVAGYVCIRVIRWLLLGDKFIVFAWYTLVLGILVIGVALVEMLLGSGGASASSVADIASVSSSAPLDVSSVASMLAG